MANPYAIGVQADDDLKTQPLAELPSSMPDFPEQPEREPFGVAWYQAKFVEQYFTPKTGTRFATEDVPAQEQGRNIKLAATATRKKDKATLNFRDNVHYRAEDLTTEAIARTARLIETGGMGTRQSIAHHSLRTLQKIAGANFMRNGRGGYDVSTLVGKEFLVRLAFKKQKDGTIGEYLEPTYYRTIDNPPDAKRTDVL